MTSRSRKTKSLAAQTTELAFAVPHVVAHRVARMAIAGPTPSARDRKEFERMVAEKGAAFAQSWQAMASQAVLAQQALAQSALRTIWTPTDWGKPAAAQKLVNHMQGATLGVLGKGLAPVHRKAVSNAKRLARTKLR